MSTLHTPVHNLIRVPHTRTLDDVSADTFAAEACYTTETETVEINGKRSYNQGYLAFTNPFATHDPLPQPSIEFDVHCMQSAASNRSPGKKKLGDGHPPKRWPVVQGRKSEEKKQSAHNW